MRLKDWFTLDNVVAALALYSDFRDLEINKEYAFLLIKRMMKKSVPKAFVCDIFC